MSAAFFEMMVSVLPQDIDEQNHVNNAVYLRWVQEVATAHWRAVASANAQKNIGWVVLRHEIDYKTPACLGDKVVLRTWVGKSTRLTFERFTEIRRRFDDQLLSKARTLWCPINAQSARPVRVPADVREQFSIWDRSGPRRRPHYGNRIPGKIEDEYEVEDENDVAVED